MLDEQGSRAPRLSRLPSSFPGQMPFRTTFSLDPLVEYWYLSAFQNNSVLRSLAAEVTEYWGGHPSLHGPITDLSVLAKHDEFLRLLLQPIFPSVFEETIPSALIQPFEFRVGFATTAFEKLFSLENGIIGGRVDLDLHTFTTGKIISAYLHILESVYDLIVPFEYPVTFTTVHPETGLELHHKIETDPRFIRVTCDSEPPPLPASKRRSLLANLSNLPAWMEAIPPSSFRFTGFGVIRAHDVTKERTVALLHRDLMEERGIVNRRILPDIEGHLRTILRKPRLELGLAILDGSDFYVLNEPEQPLVHTFFSRSRRYDVSAIRASIFEQCRNEPGLKVTEDLQEVRSRAIVEEDMLRWGVRGIIASPLAVGSELVGFLYLWTRDPSDLLGLDVITLMDLLPTFAAAVERVRDDMRNRVQKVIVGKYTAIHPTVEWRFRQAALRSIQKQERGGPLEVEPIVFDNLYPLFAATDIRASSDHRNEAIRRDLLDHLELAESIVSIARDRASAAVFHHLHARIRRYRNALQEGLTSSDEAAIRDFLQQDLEPMLVSLRGMDEGLDRAVAKYEGSVDPKGGRLYERSRAFEGSVRNINDVVAGYLDSEQAKLQPYFPHYFEKHQTDGVDFTMYVGASLLESKIYDAHFVHALRLWQLMVMCGVALRTKLLQAELDDPLETTHLILVQNTPISIRYRFDETRFDVDGPHHIRFEIMKQRVEKATVSGTGERLTQPHRIAIVYSQEREAEEYMQYLDALRAQGFISSDVESVQVDDLQGVKGLRALRIRLAANAVDELPTIDPESLRETVKGLDLPN